MDKEHHYAISLEWTGNNGTGTSAYRAYERSYKLKGENKIAIEGSSDPSFRGDKSKYNPEDLLLASIASCHMLWYLHLCAAEGICVTSYTDKATATMRETQSGSGRFTAVTLFPSVCVANPSDLARANELHEKANEMCFIANSLNFPVRHRPHCQAAT